MRLTVFSILSLGIVLISAAWADDVDAQQARSLSSSDALTAAGLSDGLSAENSGLNSDERFGLMRPWAEANSWNAEPTAQSFCYKIRRYLVERDDRNSDSTHIIGYSQCQRASRYSLKGIAPSPLK
jgi:hypothetical protein